MKFLSMIRVDEKSGQKPSERLMTEMGKLMEEATAVAEKVANYSLPVVMMIKESINRAYETSLAEGSLYERRVFQSQFCLEDQKEGMAAFVEKRKPTFKHK